MTSASIHLLLVTLSLLSAVGLAFRLLQLKLASIYPFFFAFLFTSILLNIADVFYGISSLYFFRTYVVLEPVRNIIYILVVWELFSVIFRNYAGLRSLSRWVMGGSAVIASAGFVLSVTGDRMPAFRASLYVQRVVRFERGMALGLVIFIIIMLYFISRYPIKLPRNNVVHCMLYSIWFLGDAALLLATSFLSGEFGQRIVNDGQPLFEIGCYLGWSLLLSQTGEYQETRVRRDLTPEHEKVLIGELEAMNEMLLRAGRSISHGRERY